MRILVTGATGQVGRHLVAQLQEAGHEVRALTRNPAAAKFPAGVQVVAGDLTDASTLAPAFERVDGVHLITFGGDDGQDLANGLEIIGLAEHRGIRRSPRRSAPASSPKRPVRTSPSCNSAKTANVPG